MKKLRFEIFKRDNFTCQYCGSKPPQVILEVDHVLSKKEGGTNEPENLITACFDCNRGKGARLLTTTIKRIDLNMEQLAEKKLQLKEFYKFQKEFGKLKDKQADELFEYWDKLNGRKIYYSNKEEMAIKLFLRKLDPDEVKEAMEIAVGRIYDNYNRFKYFCGICNKKIKNQQHAN